MITVRLLDMREWQFPLHATDRSMKSVVGHDLNVDIGQLELIAEDFNTFRVVVHLIDCTQHVI